MISHSRWILYEIHVALAYKCVNHKLTIVFLLSLDINECELQTDTCDDTSEICINIYGSYECHCVNGYRKENDQCIGKSKEEC